MQGEYVFDIYHGKKMWKPKIGCYKFCVYGGKLMYNSNKK